MSNSTLPRGSFLLLFPEDVSEGSITTPVYAKVKSSRGTTATATVISDDNGSEQTVKLARATALARKVNASDAEGLKLGTWLRQAVCVKHDGHYCYGQVTGYFDTGLTIRTLDGPIEATRADVCDSVYPIVTMVMGCHKFPTDAWNYERLDQVHNSIMNRLISPATDEPASPLSVSQLMLNLLPDVAPAFDRIYHWINPDTGAAARVSLQHVVNYVYYVDGGKIAPGWLNDSFGNSFCDPPAPQSSSNHANRSRLPDNSAPGHPSFFDALSVDDEAEVAADEVAIARSVLADCTAANASDEHLAPVNRAQHPRLEPSNGSRNEPITAPALTGIATRFPSAIDQETSEDAEIRELIREHKPHLLPYLLESRRNDATSRLKRPGPAEAEAVATKRNKFSFTPSAEQRRVHDAVTADSQRGKSATEFVESLVSCSEFWAYPGVATRVYDIEFGSRGLSFLHFSPVDTMVKLRRQRDSFINMSDFSVSAKLLPPADPKSWEDILAGANGLQQYCISRCDPVTQWVASSLYKFVVELKGRNLWPQDMLLTLALWIDAQLEKYRMLVVADSETSTQSRHSIASTFTPNNAELHGLLLEAHRTQVEDMRRSSDSLASNLQWPRQQQTRAQRNDSFRKETKETHPPLPQQDGKEVCLKFLSKRGCPSSNPNECNYASRAHFYPAALSNQLRSYIRRKLGGVNNRYTNN